MRIIQADFDQHTEDIRKLYWEYLQWANTRVYEEFGIDFDINSMLEEDMRSLEKFYPPFGRLLLALIEQKMAGLACMKKLFSDTGEIKRMYVREPYRGYGIGMKLLKALFIEAEKIGYQKIRLDSAKFMKAAHSLYRTSGFHEIEPYPESEIPQEFQSNWIFMEKVI